MFFLFFQKDFLRLFINDISSKNWQDTAMSWLITAIVISVLSSGLIFGYKALRKSMAGLGKEKAWTRGQTWLLIFIGIFPIFLILSSVWYFTRDFLNYIQVDGLLKGTLFAWFLYLIFMVVGHLISPWRRELI